MIEEHYLHAASPAPRGSTCFAMGLAKQTAIVMSLSLLIDDIVLHYSSRRSIAHEPLTVHRWHG